MIHRHDVRCEWDSFCVVFFPVLYEAFYLIIGILIFCLSFSLKHCIRQRERKSKYHIICFSFCTFSFRIETTIIILWQKWQQDQRIKMKFNHLQLEVRLNLQFFFFLFEKIFFLLKLDHCQRRQHRFRWCLLDVNSNDFLLIRIRFFISV